MQVELGTMGKKSKLPDFIQGPSILESQLESPSTAIQPNLPPSPPRSITNSTTFIKVHSFLGESIIVSIISCCCLCSLPVSLIGVLYASRVEMLLLQGKRDQAISFAKTARLLTLIAVVMTIGFYIAVFALFLTLLKPL